MRNDWVLLIWEKSTRLSDSAHVFFFNYLGSLKLHRWFQLFDRLSKATESNLQYLLHVKFRKFSVFWKGQNSPDFWRLIKLLENPLHPSGIVTIRRLPVRGVTWNGPKSMWSIYHIFCTWWHMICIFLNVPFSFFCLKLSLLTTFQPKNLWSGYP